MKLFSELVNTFLSLRRLIRTRACRLLLSIRQRRTQTFLTTPAACERCSTLTTSPLSEVHTRSRAELIFALTATRMTVRRLPAAELSRELLLVAWQGSLVLV